MSKKSKFQKHLKLNTKEESSNVAEMNELHGELLAKRESVPIAKNNENGPNITDKISEAIQSMRSAKKEAQAKLDESVNSNPHTKKRKKLKCDCALISMCLITMLSNSAYALIAPFLPIEMMTLGIPVYMFGYIFSMYSLAVILCSPIVGFLLQKF